RDSSSRGWRGGLSTSTFAVLVPMCSGRFHCLQSGPAGEIRLDSKGATTGRPDSPRTLQQGDRKPLKSVGANHQEPHPSHVAKGWRKRSSGDCGAVPGRERKTGGPPASNRLTNIVPVIPRFGSLFTPAMVARRASARCPARKAKCSLGERHFEFKSLTTVPSVRMITLLCPARQFHSPKPPSVDLPKALLWSRSSCAPVSRAALCRNPGSRCMRIQFDHGAAMSCVDERKQTTKQESISPVSYFCSRAGPPSSAP